MALLIDQLIEPIWRYYPLGAMAFIFVSERLLADRSRELSTMTFPGVKKARETGYFYKNACALARLAKGKTRPDCPVGAILFRDSDGTRSMGNSLWSDKWNSIMSGFEVENFPLGVPMVPKPKSEVWLLCAVQERPYSNCVRLEDISGNDASPNSAKRLLEEALAAGRESGDVSDLIRRGTIQAQNINMPSYNLFRERLEEVARRMAGIPG